MDLTVKFIVILINEYWLLQCIHIKRKLALYLVKHSQFNLIKNILISGERTPVFHAEQLTEAKKRMGTKYHKASKISQFLILSFCSYYAKKFVGLSYSCLLNIANSLLWMQSSRFVQVCDFRYNDLGETMRVRLEGAFPGLHAADVRYDF